MKTCVLPPFPALTQPGFGLLLVLQQKPGSPSSLEKKLHEGQQWRLCMEKPSGSKGGHSVFLCKDVLQFAVPSLYNLSNKFHI